MAVYLSTTWNIQKQGNMIRVVAKKINVNFKLA